jgi:hypothetical protein
LVEASHAGGRGRTSSIPRIHFGDQRMRRRANREVLDGGKTRATLELRRSGCSGRTSADSLRPSLPRAWARSACPPAEPRPPAAAGPAARLGRSLWPRRALRLQLPRPPASREPARAWGRASARHLRLEPPLLGPPPAARCAAYCCGCHSPAPPARAPGPGPPRAPVRAPAPRSRGTSCPHSALRRPLRPLLPVLNRWRRSSTEGRTEGGDKVGRGEKGIY